MTADEFGSEYAGVYDWLYSDKDYLAECDQLEDLFRRYAPAGIRSILDLGCGTGGHAFPLFDRGYEVIGVDRSEGMIAEAIRKLAMLPPEQARGLQFLQADLRALSLERSFDAVLMMFAVLGYQTTNDQVSAALAAARRHLSPGGLLVFDVWYGPAVLGQRPGDRVKIQRTADGPVIRSARPTLDERHHLCTVRYQIWQLDGEQPVREFTEDHAMRFFFPMELEQFLSGSGFLLVHLSAMGDPDAPPAASTWNVLACARAV